MENLLEIRIEIEPIKPDTPESVSRDLKDAFDKAVKESGIENTYLIPEENMPGLGDIANVCTVIQTVASLPALLDFLKALFGSKMFGFGKSKNYCAQIKHQGKMLKLEGIENKEVLVNIVKEFCKDNN
ncbi:MAG: hypothetical protein HQK88_10785 [Nitrospirae bacterium]|nr:hypothetical protein [Nitrospirota bacterium]MBF0535292.1 hypothetical protein [Nitrospirota bacterium]MBF0617285.1 hypothetical protein [Nitrospirota bacterium]